MIIRFFKKILKIILWLFLVIILFIWSGYFYLQRTELISDKELQNLSVEIKASKELPEKFYELYEKVNPNSLKYDSRKLLLLNIISDNYVHSPSVMVIKMKQYEHTGDTRLMKLRFDILAWKIEEETTQKECLNWILSNFDFMNHQIGIDKASKYYYNKNVSELNDKELIGIIVLMKNPALYNPNRRKELFNNMIDKIN